MRLSTLPLWCVALTLCAGCVESRAVVCRLGGERWLCPPGRECHATRRCIFADQRTSCEGVAPYGPCATDRIQDGVCIEGVCIERSLVGCGNGLLDATEACDGSQLAGRTCADLGYYGGTLACRPDCERYDVNGCVGFCGDGVRNGPESCDGSDLGGAICDALGHPGGGVVTCDRCAIDTNHCCQDEDGDGFGAHCILGDDCDDSAPGITGPCQANGCPEGFVAVGAGDFYMGCDAGELDGSCQADEQPRHRVTLSAYCIMRTEVTVGMYRACADAGVCTGTPLSASAQTFCNWTAAPGPREQHPINCLDWTEARQFCQQWLGGDLPSEAQWERAARGAYPDQRRYPWGDAPPDCTRCNWDPDPVGDGLGCQDVMEGPGTWPVGTAGAPGESPEGVGDLAGNVWEWVRDWYHADYYAQCAAGCSDPVNTTATGDRAFRGGGFLSDAPASLRVVERMHYLPNYRDDWIGFRCQTTP